MTDLQEGICCRFGNAYHWYCVLLLSSRKHLQDALGDARSEYGKSWCEEDAEHARDATEHSEEYAECDEDEVRLHPSEYLRRRCPVCYGGRDWRMARNTEHRLVYILVFLARLIMCSVDAIGCIDACFNQKRTHAHDSDPPNSTESFFIPDYEVQEMEAEVKALRKERSKSSRSTKRKQGPTMETEDGYEEGMRIPTSVLEGCNESFIAADEKREKVCFPAGIN